MCIMRHVKFSMRSWFGSSSLVLQKKRHTWVARGSPFLSSSGLCIITRESSRLGSAGVLASLS